MATVEALVNHTPRYFSTQQEAFDVHYTEGGYLWRRREGLPEVYEPYAAGILPVSRLAIYALYMVSGNEPTKETIAEAEKACYSKRERNEQAWFNSPL